MRKRDMLFYIETETQYDAIKPLLMHIRDDTKWSLDIVVPSTTSEGEMSNKEIYESTNKALVVDGFRVIRGVDETTMPDDVVSTQYKLLLSAYMYQWHYDNLHARYFIMYPYASYYFNKPMWTIERFIQLDYLADALLSHSTGTRSVTDIFTKTYLVAPLKLGNFVKKEEVKQKPVLFFAPTYEEIDFAVKILQDIGRLKEQYTITMRGHHRVARLKKNRDVFQQLYQAADTIYDPKDCGIITPLQEADVVLSDNSGVIFDAIYCGVPVALFSQDPDSFHYKDIHTAQSELVKNGEVLWTNDPSKITSILDETLKPKILQKQKTMRKRMFPIDNTDPIGQWMTVLSHYLNDEVPSDYSLAKRYWIESKRDIQIHNEELSERAEKLNSRLEEAQANISHEQNPGVKIAARRFARACLQKARIIKRGR